MQIYNSKQITNFDDFMKILQNLIKRAEFDKSLYTSNNIEQIYRANHLQILKDIEDLCYYYKYNSNNSDVNLRLIFIHIKQLYLQESETLKTIDKVNVKLHYGIIDTYHELLNWLFYTESITTWLYSNGMYIETRDELNLS